MDGLEGWSLLVGNGPDVVCVPGFCDSVGSWHPLLSALAQARLRAAVVRLPGFGGRPPGPQPASLAGCTAEVVRQVQGSCRGQVVLVGHSLGAVTAVAAAGQLGERCAGLVSLEGNLTPQDAYFSGQAADFDEAQEFKRAFTAQVDALVVAGTAPATFADAVRAADAGSMWSLGRDARVRGDEGGFGEEYRGLASPTLYVWARTTTPPSTQEYLVEHAIPAHRVSIEHHWPWTIDPDAITETLRIWLHEAAPHGTISGQ